MSLINSVKADMEKTLQVLEDDLRTLRPGRASGDLLGSIPVEAYGQSMTVSQVASVSVNEQGQVLVQPWDKATIGAVDTAIRNSQLGFSVVNEGTILRLSVPPLNQERRAEFVKLVSQKGEAARIQLRQVRGDAHQKASRQKAAGEMREDDLNRLTKELNELIEQYNTKIKQLVERKEQELMSV